MTISSTMRTEITSRSTSKTSESSLIKSKLKVLISQSPRRSLSFMRENLNPKRRSDLLLKTTLNLLGLDHRPLSPKIRLLLGISQEMKDSSSRRKTSQRNRQLHSSTSKPSPHFLKTISQRANHMKAEEKREGEVEPTRTPLSPRRDARKTRACKSWTGASSRNLLIIKPCFEHTYLY